MSLFTGRARSYWLNIHIILVGLFLPLLIIIPLSGTQYLLGMKGTVVKEEAFRVNTPFTKDAKVLRSILKKEDQGFTFEYVKNRKSYLVLRPSTRVHYEVYPSEEGMIFKKVDPNWIKILQELHFGHGPRMIKKLQIGFGIAFFLVILSGFALALSLRSKLPILLLGSFAGCIVMIIGFL